MAIPPLILRIVADSSGVKKGVAEANAGVSGFKSSVTQNAALIKTALAGAVVAGFAVAIKAAADLGESQNKANVIFGESVKSVNAFASSAATGFGLAKAEALEGAASFGAMFDSARIAEGASAKMSVTMGKLAGDMASFNNQDPSEMLERLRSGLAGEAEPLRRFGVFISEARVQTEAYRLGLAQVGEELTDAQKIQARYSIILKDTTKQQGDFARTLGESLPNQLRVLRAEFINIAAEIGKELLPAVLELTKTLRELLPVIKLVVGSFANAFGDVAVMIGEVSRGVGTLLALDFTTGLGAWRDGVQELADELNAGNISVAEFEEGLVALASHARAHVEITDQQRRALQGLAGVSGLVTEATKTVAGAVRGATDEISEAAETNREAARATRELRNAQLQLAGGFLGLIGAADQLQAAHKELRELERKGKEGTEAYRDATLSGLEAQLSLKQGLADYGTELHDAGETQRDVMRTVRNLAEQFGLQDAGLRDLLRDVREYIGALNSIPSQVSTTVSFTGTRTTARQHGGPVSAFRPYIVGERGPELFVPSTSGRIVASGGGAGGAGGTGGDIVFQMDGREFARITRDQLYRFGRRNVTAGIP